MQATKSGFYGLFFVVLLSGQLIRPHVGSSTIQLLINTALPLVVVFLLLIPLAKFDYQNPTGIRRVMWCIIFGLGLATTVIEAVEFYNTVSNERINILFFSAIMFVVALYAGMLDCSSVKTAGMFISFMLMFFIITVLLFNLQSIDIANIDIFTNIETDNMFLDAISSIALVPAFVMFNRQNELKISRVAVLLLSVLVVVVLCGLAVEAILKSDSPFFTIPLHTLAVVAEFSIFRRLDVVIRIILFLAGMIKMCVFSTSLSFMLKRKVFYVVMGLSFLITIFSYNSSNDNMITLFAMISLLLLLISLFKKRTSLVSVIISCVILTGCSGQELRERAAVTMTYIDWDGQYTVSILVVTEYGKDEPVTSLISGEGESISSALFEASKQVNGELYMGINEVILLGDNLSNQNFSDMLTQMYDARLSSGKSYFFLSEHTPDDMIDHENELMDAADAVLKQSRDSRTVTKRVYDINITGGKVEGVFPIIDLFDDSGIVADSAALYKEGERINTLDDKQLEMYAALSGDRKRLAVEYDYDGAQFVSELSGANGSFELDGDNLVVTIAGTAEGRLDKEKLEAMKKELTDRICEILLISIEREADIFGLQKEVSVNLSDIKSISVIADIAIRL